MSDTANIARVMEKMGEGMRSVTSVIGPYKINLSSIYPRLLFTRQAYFLSCSTLKHPNNL